MAKNDSILIDGILDERIHLKLPSDKRDEVFEYFAIEQILKDLNLSSEDITFGSVDGKDDGGIDGFYIFINGHLLKDPETFFWPKSNAELEVHVITCKHHDTFKQSPLDNIAATLTEIFDFSVDKGQLKGNYNRLLLEKRELLKIAYRRVSSRLTSFSIKIAYASRGDSSFVSDPIVARGNQIIKITTDLFGACDVSLSFYGSAELVSLNRKVPNFSLELPFIEALARGERYVLLSSLSDYNKFITDESGKLRRYLFDSNVRDFMGLNRVNEDIRATLDDDDSPDFWWLNNGVTILATSARVIGKTIHIEDIQIVNGLQTTESIYRYFLTGKADRKHRSVLVKIIVSQENDVRDAIIRATNNQTVVELSALHATDKIQRDIEQILEKSGFYYERRTNHYTNQGIKPELIFTPLYLASGYVSLVLKGINKATSLKGRFMRNPSSYEKIFNEKTSLETWPLIASILRKTDSFLESIRTEKAFQTERFLKKWRQIVSYLTVARLIGKVDFSIAELLNVNIENYTPQLLKESWDLLYDLAKDEAFKAANHRKGFVTSALHRGAQRFNLSGFESFARWSAAVPYDDLDKKVKTISKIRKKEKMIAPKKEEQHRIPLTEEFIEKVNQALPEQPWKPGMHKVLTKQLNCTIDDLSWAIDTLIATGKRFRQKDGIVYNADGSVLKIDADRVDPATLKPKE